MGREAICRPSPETNEEMREISGSWASLLWLWRQGNETVPKDCGICYMAAAPGDSQLWAGDLWPLPKYVCASSST